MITKKTFYLLLFILLSANTALATDYYIAKTGNDGNSGTSTSSPWFTTSKADSTLIAGDTVYLRTGTYTQTINPTNSGTTGNYITYRAYEEEVVTITDSYDLADLSGKSYIVIDGLRFIDAGHYWINMEGATNCIISNGYYEKARGWAGFRLTEGANYNKIQNNTLIATCPCSSICEDQGGPHDIVNIKDSNHILVEGNIIVGGTHDAIGVYDRVSGQNYTVIRNNYIQNKMHSNIDIWGIEYLLFENNVVADGGNERTTNWCGSDGDRAMPDLEHKGIMTNTKYAIIRNNTAVNNGTGISLTTPSNLLSEPWKVICTDNRYYNNTISRNITGVRHNSVNPTVGNIIKNNIMYNNRSYEVDIYDGTGTDSTNYFINNNILGASQRYSDGDTTSNNISVNPEFINLVSDPNSSESDFNLQSTSPMIDAGVFLTVTVGSGSGTTITVDDARYFMDGWGIIEGDLIQLDGQTQTSRITNVNYSTNVLTVDTSLTWSSGQGVSLPYEGTAPDIGAFEYSDGTPTAPAFTSATINGTAVVINFSVACTRGGSYTNGDFDLDMSVTGNNISIDYVSGEGTTQWIMVASSSAVNGEPVNLDFNGSANSVEDTSGTDLAALLSEVVTNTTDAPEITPVSRYFEAEDMDLITPMVIVNDAPASGGRCVVVTTGDYSSEPAAEATEVFTLSETGTYYLWLKINGLDGSHHALYVGIDDTWDRVYHANNGFYEWVRVEIEHLTTNYGFALTAGAHTLRIGHGELNAKADILYLTTDPEAVPTEEPVAAPGSANPPRICGTQITLR